MGETTHYPPVLLKIPRLPLPAFRLWMDFDDDCPAVVDQRRIARKSNEVAQARRCPKPRRDRRRTAAEIPSLAIIGTGSFADCLQSPEKCTVTKRYGTLWPACHKFKHILENAADRKMACGVFH